MSIFQIMIVNQDTRPGLEGSKGSCDNKKVNCTRVRWRGKGWSEIAWRHLWMTPHSKNWFFPDFDDDDLADLLSDEDSKPKAKNTANLEPASQPPSQPLDPPKTSAAASQNRSKTMQELFGIDPGTKQTFESNIKTVVSIEFSHVTRIAPIKDKYPHRRLLLWVLLLS